MQARGARRALLAVMAAVALLIGLPAGAAQAAGSGERILSFDADYQVNPDGSMDVTETLKWQFGPGAHHGIKRYIITRQGYKNEQDRIRTYRLSDADASSPTGASPKIQQSESGPHTILRIGDPDETVDGTQTYVVKYRLAHVVNHITEGGDDHVELYWNVTGNETSIPTDRVSVTVHGPAAVSKAACYYGASQSTDRCQASSGQQARFSAKDLAPREGMTAVAAFPTAAFTDTSPELVDGGNPDTLEPVPFSGMSQGSAKALTLLGGGVGVLIPVLAAALMGLLVWRRGRDEQFAGLTPGLMPARGEPAQVVRGSAPTVAVQFQPPPGVRAGLLGTIIDEEANTIDVSATVIDLAVRGFLRIEEVKAGGLGALVGRNDWKLTRLQPRPGEELLPYESTVLEGLFKDANPVNLSDLKNEFHSTLSKAKEQLYAETVHRGWFRKSPQTQRAGWMMVGAIIFFVGVAVLFYWGFNSVGLDHRGGISLGLPSGVILGLGLMVAGFITRLLGKRMASRTAVGSAILAQSEGFRQYLVTAEARQIRFEEAQDVFSRYLPYAIVFGVADRWAKVFGEVAEAAAAAGRPLMMPAWYVFAGNASFGGFAGIANGVDSFSSMASGTFTSTPGSSGGSGFSGGGFSGGGGGGGGSGSW